MKAFLVLLVTGTALLAQTPAPKSPPKAPPKSTTGTKAAPKAARPNPLLNPAALTARCPDLLRVKFTTTHGDFTVEAHRDWAPIGADRFYNLVRNKFFNDAAFFRIVPNFIVQFGMSADPAVSKAWQNANMKDEPVKHGNLPGTLVFAKTAMPNTRTTQLFINLGDNTRSLDPQGFSAFGEVTEGMDVVKTLYSGYGEAPDQGKITAEGKAYLDKNFPKLDRVLSTTIVFPEPAAAPAKKAAPAAAPKKSATPPAK